MKRLIRKAKLWCKCFRLFGINFKKKKGYNVREMLNQIEATGFKSYAEILNE